MQGATPIPTTTVSASTEDPSARRTRSARPSPSMAATPTPVEASGPLPEPKVGHDGFVDAEPRTLGVPAAVENLLGERRSVVGEVGLLADDGQRSVEALAAQRLGRAHAGQGCADDDDALRRQ